MMKNISPTLLNFLQTKDSFFRADVMLIELTNGVQITATLGSQFQILFGYLYGSPTTFTFPKMLYYPTLYGTWERGKVTSEASFAPKSHTMDLTVISPDTVLFPNTTVPLMQMITSGVFDAATVYIWTTYGSLPYSGNNAFGPLTDPSGEVSALLTFAGRIANFSPAGRSKVKFLVADMLYLLNYDTPPNLIQSGCRFQLFDAGCSLAKGNFQFATTVAAGTTRNVINLTSAVSGASWWNANMTLAQGTMLYASGMNSGIWFYIKQMNSTTQIQLSQALPFAPTVGDTIYVYPGCAKTLAACSKQFNNLIHIGAMPYVPNPETAV